MSNYLILFSPFYFSMFSESLHINYKTDIYRCLSREIIGYVLTDVNFLRSLSSMFNTAADYYFSYRLQNGVYLTFSYKIIISL